MNISNRSLALLLVAAMAISIAGTFYSLNEISDITTPVGFATSNNTGNVTLEVESNIACTLNNDNTLDFGAGYVTGNDVWCYMRSNDSSLDSANCQGSLAAPDASFILENTGNVNATVTMYTNETLAGFLPPGTDSTSSTDFMYQAQVFNNESGSCPGASLVFDTYGPIGVGAANANTTCDNQDFLFSPESSDSLGINVLVNFTQDLTTGDHKASITMVCRDV